MNEFPWIYMRKNLSGTLLAPEMERKIQLDEIDVLKSIFYNDEFQVIRNCDTDDIQIIFWAHLTLPEDFSVKYKENLETDEYSYVKISYLPPVKLHLSLPEAYPSRCSPKFIISCQWLTKHMISKLCRQLDKLWFENENMEIIYVWIDFLKNELFEFLGITSELDLTELYYFHLKYLLYRESKLKDKQSSIELGNGNEENIIVNSDDQSSKISASGNDEKYKEQKFSNIINHKLNRQKIVARTSFYYNSKYQQHMFSVGAEKKAKTVSDQRACLNLNLKTSPLRLLVNYNAEREQVEFEKKVFTCTICFTDQLGVECTKFDACDHVFCKGCICSYFTVQINDGNVHPIKCPETKCSSDATPLQVKALVSPELYMKYDSLLLQFALDSLEHVIYCPRTFCQYPAARDGDDNLAICPNCQYVFCIFCKMVYHGIEPCKLKSEEKKKLVEKYLNASKEVKEQMELCYGVKQLQTLMNNSLAETWIESNCKNCPHCKVSIEKSKGCNKMLCWKCSTYFCWLCSAVLDRANPYSHYGDNNSRCANKLFYLTPFDPEEELEDYNSDDEQWHDWDWV